MSELTVQLAGRYIRLEPLSLSRVEVVHSIERSWAQAGGLPWMPAGASNSLAATRVHFMERVMDAMLIYRAHSDQVVGYTYVTNLDLKRLYGEVVVVGIPQANGALAFAGATRLISYSFAERNWSLIGLRPASPVVAGAIDRLARSGLGALRPTDGVLEVAGAAWRAAFGDLSDPTRVASLLR